MPISEWEQQATYSSHTTPSFVAPSVSECGSYINYYPAPAQPAPPADDKQQRPNDTSAAAFPVTNTISRITNTNRLNDDDEED